MLTENNKLVIIKAEQTAATSTVTSDHLDITGWDGCLLFTNSGSTTATNIYATVNQYDGTSNTDIASATFSNANDCYAFDIYRPLQSTGKYLSLDITRTTSTATNVIYALLYQGRKATISQDSDTQLKRVIGATSQ